MNANDLPPSYEDAIKFPPPSQAGLAHHYTPPSLLTPSAPPVSYQSQPTQPYAVSNAASDGLPTYHYPPVVLHRQAQSSSGNSGKSCFIAFFIMVFIMIFIFVIVFALSW
ncbi:hypothetical protein O3P69_014823 [Scylla paramamosain]|uniref:Uncharacterized protein n=1 Tax=Scylla paramamosain TaxID=85552 RepID=A0AAW0TY10_SCYPA